MRASILTIIFFIVPIRSYNQISFNEFFMNCSMRIDYIQTANADSSLYALSQIKQEPYWGGSMNNLIDTFRYGTNVVEVYDSATNKLIYSRGYATLCSEWQKTKEAKSVCRSFEETVIVPFPKRAIRIEILSRDDLNQFHKVFEYRINPHSLSIIKDKCNIYITESIIKVAESQNAVDIVFIPDGYTLEEMAKFKMDAEIFAQSMLTWKPFEQYKNSFNFWAVNVPSAESGTDIPGENIWANTALNTTFNTFNSERYLSTQSIKNVRDAAGHVPYDQIVILVNSGIYGGGGIYNFYAILSADNENSEFVFCHEFGHSFAALADEYYDDETTYIDFYNLDIEPYQPNITTIVDFNLKWADLVDSLTPIPTPETPEFIDKIGVFEGGGYVQNGIYRPTYNSSMKSGVINNFGPVNERAIIQMIRFYIE